MKGGHSIKKTDFGRKSGFSLVERLALPDDPNTSLILWRTSSLIAERPGPKYLRGSIPLERSQKFHELSLSMPAANPVSILILHTAERAASRSISSGTPFGSWRPPYLLHFFRRVPGELRRNRNKLKSRNQLLRFYATVQNPVWVRL